MPLMKRSTSEPGPHNEPRTLDLRRLGHRRYAEVWELQKSLVQQRIADEVGDTLILVEHNHVYTLGRNADENNLIADEAWLKGRGVEIFNIERGGDITYHGPGQIVGYPILALRRHGHDIHKYLRDIEEVIIRTLAEYDIEGGRDPENTGVWVGSEKIAAIGVKLTRWITMHGFAFNINTDLNYFTGIIPCGIQHKGVTTLQRLLGRDVPLPEVEEKVINHFKTIFRITDGVREIADC
jgi:lipoyl(octanoyl) transferase